MSQFQAKRQNPLNFGLLKWEKKESMKFLIQNLPLIALLITIETNGYDDKWIKQRLTGIIDRHKLTDVWKESGITKNYEYGILTNEIYRQWSGMKASQYKEYKGLRKESLRDNMTDIEVTLANLGEIATRELVKEHKPYGLKENREMAKRGGKIAKNTRNNLEKELGKSVISKGNSLNYKYIDEKNLNTTAELNNKHPEKPK